MKIFSFLSKNKEKYLLLILLLLSLVILFWNLGANSLRNWDEAIYALISYEVLQNPSLTLHLNGEVWFEKPPLGFFVESVFIYLLGFNEFAIRLPSAIYSLLSVIFIYLLGKELCNKYFGFFSALFTLISPLFLHNHITRSGDLDSSLLLFWLASFYFLVKYQTNKNYFYLSAVYAGLAVMFRGSYGLFIPVISASYLLLTSSWKKLNIRDYLYYISLFCLIVLPWHIHQLVVHGENFWDTYVLQHILNRIDQPIQNHSGPWYSYFIFFQKNIGFLHIVFWLSFVYSSIRMVLAKNKNLLLLWLWFILTIIPLIIMETKLYWYSITLIPVIYYFIVYFLQSMLRYLQNLFRRRDYSKKGFIFKALPSIIFIITVVFYQVVFSFQAYNFVTQDKTAPIERISNYLVDKNEKNLVLYRSLKWYNNWLLPQAKYYLFYKSNIKSYLVGVGNVEYYIANKGYDYFVVEKSYLSEIRSQTGRKFQLEKVLQSGRFLLLKKSNVK